MIGTFEVLRSDIALKYTELDSDSVTLVMCPEEAFAHAEYLFVVKKIKTLHLIIKDFSSSITWHDNNGKPQHLSLDEPPKFYKIWERLTHERYVGSVTDICRVNDAAYFAYAIKAMATSMNIKFTVEVHDESVPEDLLIMFKTILGDSIV